ncbi:MAG: DUF3987 domain-containing protein [Methylococcaceae bacterium]
MIDSQKDYTTRPSAGQEGQFSNYADLPDEMQNAKRWLVWKYEPNPEPTKKPRKVPYYANGSRRTGALDRHQDMSSLATFNDALFALQSGQYSGLGFALGPDGTGNYWQGIDLDNLPDHPELAHIAEDLPGYTEQSPSGKGMHAIGYGRAFASMGSNGTGIEAYSSGRYFTVTAEGSGIHPPVCLAGFVEQRLRPLHGRKSDQSSAHESETVEQVPPDVVRDLRSALFFMRADDRELWQRMGHALKTLSNVGRGLWLEWSSTSEKYEPAEDAKTWETFKPTRTGYKAVFAEAQRQGWVNPGRQAPDGTDDDVDGQWPDPQPLTAKIDPEPYPVDALPDEIREAVEEVQGFVKAPMPIVGSSALGSLSLATQAHVNMKRAERLSGPSSLFPLSIADSGERKSTVDGFFMEPFSEYEAEQEELAAPLIKKYDAELSAWNAQRDGILSAIRTGATKGKDTSKMKDDLIDLERNKPEPPLVPRLKLGDETPENLAYILAKGWPSAGVVSSEAGVVFGAHGMSKESAMRNLGLLNVLWDGGELSIGRRTSDSFTVKGARLTVALQVQESVLRAFLEKTGGLARGSGFLARFLIAWPESTQGYRLFTEPPQSWPKLGAFNRRISQLLNTLVPMNKNGRLEPAMLTFTPAAKAAWVYFHDALEIKLRSGGSLYDVRDVASKTADNAARLAALFHVFKHGPGGAVDIDSFEGASRIAAWHLSESRRFFGELALPEELANASRLDAWLIEYCKRERTHLIRKSVAMQFGPLRQKASLDGAISQLEELDRLRVRKDSKRITLALNPKLLDFANANPANFAKDGSMA